MNAVVQINLTPEQIINAIKALDEIDQQDFIEDLLASCNPDYLNSIKEAREDYRSGRISSHEEVFG